MTPPASPPSAGMREVREHFRQRGMRWTSQRRHVLDALESSDGHVTGSELVERCRALDPDTTPSTVYRTLRVLEELGVVQHAHGADGREEYHVRPTAEHGHLHCEVCGSSWEIGPEDAAATIGSFRKRRGFTVNLSHLTVVGRCASCTRRTDG
ncbi:MAG TPA: Fur family transcriptional regulator [Candidatus Limnocylindria bacterium]|nr:Fur family transcriptional regulator [Candidatus Limnocylindria bacterium]